MTSSKKQQKQQAKQQAKIDSDISRVRYCIDKINKEWRDKGEKFDLNYFFDSFLTEFRYEIHTFDYYKTEMKKGFYIRFYEGEEAQLVFLEDEKGNTYIKLDDFRVYTKNYFGI